jgi:hypothetical protein
VIDLLDPDELLRLCGLPYLLSRAAGNKTSCGMNRQHWAKPLPVQS